MLDIDTDAGTTGDRRLVGTTITAESMVPPSLAHQPAN
jgi:hypothetical protein